MEGEFYNGMTMVTIYFFVILFACYFFVACGFSVPKTTRESARSSSTKLHVKKARSRATKLSPSDRSLKNALESCLDASLDAQRDVILVVDANNVRGKSDFELTNAGLLGALRTLKQDSYPGLNIVCTIDHGSLPDLFIYEGVGIVEFAGPNRTADDVIAQSTRWFTNATEGDSGYNEDNLGVDVFVVTSDGGLRARCLRSNRPGNFKRKRKVKENVKVFASQQLLGCFEKTTTNPSTTLVEKTILEIEEDLRVYEWQKPPWKSRQAQLDAQTVGPWRSSVLSPDAPRPTDDGLVKQYAKGTFHEATWHRILIAENLRRMMASMAAPKEHASPLLQKYRRLFEDSLSTESRGASSPCSLVYDRRIRYEPDLQRKLVEYLESAVASASAEGPGTRATPESCSSPVEEAAGLLKAMVGESPEKTQDEILLRYMNEAPRYLQFSRKKDLKELLLCVAVREKHEGSSRKRWRVREDHPALDFWPHQPSPNRRQRKRRSEAQQRESLRVDDALVEAGERAEDDWFRNVRWPRELVAPAPPANT